jgi:KDO2-lipid IV(A) lauroyltransferase
MITEAGPRPPFTPRHWPAWLAVSLLWLLGKTPQRTALALSVPLSAVLHAALRRRRRIAARNIERCFPELGAAQRDSLVKACFGALARMLFEVAWSWSAPQWRLRAMGHVEGLEHVAAARREGRGVLFVTAHMTHMELGARLLATQLRFGAIYRPLRNSVLEWYQNRSRLSYGEALIRKGDMRSAVKVLRRGGMIWYAPDQDFGREQSVFAPFFGIQTATLLATHRLAQLTACAVVPMFPFYDEVRRHYVVRVLPALQQFPGPDAVADLARVNAVMEEHIRAAPQQYWWIHRRFKTRPETEPPFYD